MKVALLVCLCLLATLAAASEEHEDQIDGVEGMNSVSRTLAAANGEYEDELEAVQDDGVASRDLLDFRKPGKPGRFRRPHSGKPGKRGLRPSRPKKPFRGLKVAGASEEHENKIEAVQDEGLASRQLLDFRSSRRPGRPGKPGRPRPKPIRPKKPFRGLKMIASVDDHEHDIEAVQDAGFTSRQLFGKPFGRKRFGPKPPKRRFRRKQFLGKKRG